MIRPPSQQHEYDLFWSGDDAIKKPAPDAGADDLALHAHRLDVARETGDWSQILDGEPTRFRCRQVPGEVFRAIADLNGSRAIGALSSNQLIVRAALVGVANMGAVQVKLAEDTAHGLGRIATADITNLLDSISPSIVNELANEISRRFFVRPK